MKKNLLLIFIALIIVVAVAYFVRQKNTSTSTNLSDITSITQPSESNYTDIEAQEAYELIMNSGSDLAIVDVSPHFETGRLPGAVNYYVGDGSLAKAIPSLDKSKTYLVYCHVDSASIAGAEALIKAGFSKVYRLKGNYAVWFNNGYPIEISLKAVDSHSGSGIANRSFLDDQFTHQVQADLAAPTSGKFYEGWLVKGNDFFSTGKLEEKDGQYVLKYLSQEDNRDYKKVVITQETEDQGLDNQPEIHILEGEFE